MSPCRKNAFPPGFERPTSLPKSEEQSRRWQQANRAWWESHPMRYDWKKAVPHEEFSEQFYQEIDRRFFSDSRHYLPWDTTPFDALIDFASLSTRRVLEIGVGNGSHAQLFAQHARFFAGIDLTRYAAQSTLGRFRRFNLRGTILQMDAEQLGFRENSFDFVWSWGVIHHSSDTRNVLREIHRVLKPAGKAVLMIYHRNIWNYYFVGGFLRGVLMGDLLKTRSLHRTVQRWTDGALARFYTVPEWRALCSEFFSVDEIQIRGAKSDLLLLPFGKLKSIFGTLVPDRLSRFLTHRCRMGSFLISTLRKS